MHPPDYIAEKESNEEYQQDKEETAAHVTNLNTQGRNVNGYCDDRESSHFLAGCAGEFTKSGAGCAELFTEQPVEPTFLTGRNLSFWPVLRELTIL